MNCLSLIIIAIFIINSLNVNIKSKSTCGFGDLNFCEDHSPDNSYSNDKPYVHHIVKKGNTSPNQNTILTSQNCECISECKTSISSFNILQEFKWNWCYTKGRCGYNYMKTWDYCNYVAKKSYEVQSAKTKLDKLWNLVIKDKQSSKYPSPFGIVAEDVDFTFKSQWDVLPENRKKLIHGVGSVAKFKFVANSNSPFTGLFGKGEKSTGLIRMGSAKEVSPTSGVVPGIGFKFMRSGKQSGNFVSLISLNTLPSLQPEPKRSFSNPFPHSPAKNYNFFADSFSNAVKPELGLTTALSFKFQQASGCSTGVGLSDICKYNAAGIEVPQDQIRFPFKLLIKPLNNINSGEAPILTGENYQDRLDNVLKQGTSLFDFYGFVSPQQYNAYKLDSNIPANQPVKFGTLTLTSDATQSKFGDESLFFRHQLIEEDWNLMGHEWLSAIDYKEQCGLTSPYLSYGSIFSSFDFSKIQPPTQCPYFQGTQEDFVGYKKIEV